jgi:hypothetical protein
MISYFRKFHCPNCSIGWTDSLNNIINYLRQPTSARYVTHGRELFIARPLHLLRVPSTRLHGLFKKLDPLPPYLGVSDRRNDFLYLFSQL